ncbi:MAG: hypothetical protein J1E97_08325 [Muribaculaceae bacterium]|nr:hypothetical protein [Muribaculaceae bacterium]
MKKTIFFFTYLLAILTLASCEEPEKNIITIETLRSSEIEYESAVLQGRISIEGSPVIKEIGFFYGTTPNPTLRAQVSNFSMGKFSIQNFSVQLEGLNEGTLYYFQAYAIDGNDQLIKGEELSFSTRARPKVTIDELSLTKVRLASTNRDEYEFLGDATLQFKGHVVKEAGFIISADEGLDASFVMYPGTAIKLKCAVQGGVKIFLGYATFDTRNIHEGSSYVMAYMILENGMIVTSETHKVSI